MTSRKPIDPVRLMNELSIGDKDGNTIIQMMLVEMRQRGIKLNEATHAQFVALHDHALEKFERANKPKAQPPAKWRTKRKRRGYPPRH